MPRHQLTQEDRSRGGKNQPLQAKIEGGRKGFETTMDRHPFFARKHLKKKIHSRYPHGRVGTFDDTL